jgi:hypothetical protein
MAIDHGPLDEPMVVAVASDAKIDARLAQIEVTPSTGGAVVVSIGNSPVAAVAADGKFGGYQIINSCFLTNSQYHYQESIIDSKTRYVSPQ